MPDASAEWSHAPPRGGPPRACRRHPSAGSRRSDGGCLRQGVSSPLSPHVPPRDPSMRAAAGGLDASAQGRLPRPCRRRAGAAGRGGGRGVVHAGVRASVLLPPPLDFSDASSPRPYLQQGDSPLHVAAGSPHSPHASPGCIIMQASYAQTRTYACIAPSPCVSV